MRFRAKVIYKQMLTSSLGILRFETEKKLDFIPGQFCNIKIEKQIGKKSKTLVRPYSITSVPEDKYVEFYIKAYEDGEVASHILALENGDTVEIIGPAGLFKLQNTDSEIYFICAGSGVAPVMGMARYLFKSKRKRTFLQGASYVKELGYAEELQKIAEEDSDFIYIPAISRPGENPGWKGNSGRVEALLDNCTNTRADAYICGPPLMVDSIAKELLKKGFSENKIFKEKYY